jgi:S-adenosylmethionine:tRNA ribosyltransferase-isomerase
MTRCGPYDFDLPPELVAQDPPAERGASQLLILDRDGRVRGVRPFTDLPDLLAPGDLLVANDSRVLPARLWTVREDTGGRVELLLIRPDATAPGDWQAMARPARRLRPGLALTVAGSSTSPPAGPRIIVRERAELGVVVTAPDGSDFVSIAERWGDVPLPPYIRRDPEDPAATERRSRDRERYQTVYARPTADPDGASVAAPTAGLHFAADLLATLEARGVALARVTLHVGPGTFQPPSPEQIAAGRLHPEFFRMPAATSAAVAECRRRGGRVVAVGTTSLRVLATVAALGLIDEAPVGAVHRFDETGAVFHGMAEREAAGWRIAGTTRLFIKPPATVTAADALVTNFHLPGSSLLMLVAAFAGEDSWRAAYAEAVARRLRFYSYGDAMFVRPAPQEGS